MHDTETDPAAINAREKEIIKREAAYEILSQKTRNNVQGLNSKE